MLKKRKLAVWGAVVCLLMLAMSSVTVFAAEETTEYVPKMYASFWALVPPVVAIVLALITKEVYSSLFVGIVIGGLFWSGFSFENTVLHVFQDGIVGVLTDSYNMGILVFLVILGIMVCMMNKAGGSAAFGRWASVPVCIIAPISSWAAAVTGFVEGEDGFSIFLRAIPFNYYALLTILTMVLLVVLKVDYGSMRVHEDNALRGDIYTTPDRPYADAQDDVVEEKGGVIDLVFPILVLIGCCIIGMLYSGGFFSGVSFVEAFSASDASVGLMLGSFFAFVITVIFYALRRVLKFTDSMACIPDGFKAMVPAILILTFAWTLKAMTDSLGAAEYVAGVMETAATGLVNFLPAIIFLVGCFLAFATGTSWGTFGILIPIVVAVFQGTNETMMIISISACMAGAVCGDHCSPISDTTIMASAGAQCNHVNHVSTQLPYAMTVAAVSFVTYVIAGFVQNAWICLPIGIILMTGTLLVIRAITGKEE